MRTFAQKQNQPQKPVSSSLARSNTGTSGPQHHTNPLLRVQRTIGNQAVHDCPCGGGCPKCQGEYCGHLNLQTKAVHANNSQETEALPAVHEVLRSSGRPLDPVTQTYYELRFRHDFSNVRVHTDERAAQSARALNALAYTAGHNVVFADRQYAPSTRGGQRLLAHELTHVIQQRGGDPPTQGALKVSLPGDEHELQAETAAKAFDHRLEHPATPIQSPIMIARQQPGPPTRTHSDAGYAPPPGGVVSPDVTVTPQTLNRAAAVAYGRRWANSNNPEFIATSGGGDCTEFVSQAMFAGGWSMVTTGDPVEFRRNDRWFSLRRTTLRTIVRGSTIDRSYTWAGAQNFAEFVRISGRGTQVTDPMLLEPGDVIQFRARRGGHIHHSMLVTGKTSNDLLISQNSIPLLDHPFSAVRARNDRLEDYVYWRMF